MFRLRAAGVLFAVWMMLAAIPVLASIPIPRSHNTAINHGGTDTGLPQNTVHAIVQGRDGFLWIATEGGLVRFDGVEFRTMTHEHARSAE